MGQILIIAHAIPALAAVVLGGSILAAPKGTKRHKQKGRVNSGDRVSYCYCYFFIAVYMVSFN